ncbi:SGNH/GDSL hydrolase family protein [Chryseobacterium aureum]|uniref:SGNH/GDSL hydrolase family protein n=1 Tax=Chryseobacterium aureum TaxID=2497456 RepID=UPI000F8869A7|nr:SGNH/GDSL hydrolase family protein [Chryseobacterium aureum]
MAENLGEVNPDLIIIKRVSELPSDANPQEILGANTNGRLVRTQYSDLKASVTSGIKGEATPSSSPTTWAPGDSNLYERWDVKTAGTYTNFKNGATPPVPIEVTADDLRNNYVQIWVTNGVSEKVLSEKPVKDVTDTFEPENNQDPQGGKQINDYYTKKTVVKSRNLINPAAVDFDHYYSDGPKAIVDNTGFNWVVTESIPVTEGKTYVQSHDPNNVPIVVGGYFKNETDTTAVANIVGFTPEDGTGAGFTVPVGQEIKYVRLSINTTDNTHSEIAGNYQLEEAPYHSLYTPYFDPIEITSLKPEFNSLNNWSGKHITHAGTSIPAGYPKQFDLNYRYPDIAANRLGAIMNNISVPSSTIRMTKSDGSAVAYPLRAFSNEASTVNYQNAIIDKLNGPEDPALVALDFGVNDYVADQSDIDNYATFDMTSEDRATFIGATNFVIKKILQAKPTQRIVLLTHFTDTAVAFVSSYANLNKAIERIGEYWGIPVCKVYQKAGWGVKNGVNILGTMCPDGIHPASMSSDYSVQQLSRIYGDFIESI